MPASIRVIHASDADARWVVRDRVRFMGELDGTDLTVVEVEVPPGSGTPPHRHKSPEIFRVLDGEITFGLFDAGPPRTVVGRAGTVVTVPSGLAHNYQNSGATPASMLVVVERSMAEFFRDVGQIDAPPAGPPTPIEIGAVIAACVRHGITVLGQPAA